MSRPTGLNCFRANAPELLLYKLAGSNPQSRILLRDSPRATGTWSPTRERRRVHRSWCEQLGGIDAESVGKLDECGKRYVRAPREDIREVSSAYLSRVGEEVERVLVLHSNRVESPRETLSRLTLEPSNVARIGTLARHTRRTVERPSHEMLRMRNNTGTLRPGISGDPT